MNDPASAFDGRERAMNADNNDRGRLAWGLGDNLFPRRRSAELQAQIANLSPLRQKFAIAVAILREIPYLPREVADVTISVLAFSLEVPDLLDLLDDEETLHTVVAEVAAVPLARYLYFGSVAMTVNPDDDMPDDMPNDVSVDDTSGSEVTDIFAPSEAVRDAVRNFNALQNNAPNDVAPNNHAHNHYAYNHYAHNRHAHNHHAHNYHAHNNYAAHDAVPNNVAPNKVVPRAAVVDVAGNTEIHRHPAIHHINVQPRDDGYLATLRYQDGWFTWSNGLREIQFHVRSCVLYLIGYILLVMVVAEFQEYFW